MRRLLPILLLCGVVAACGGGTSAADAYAQRQIGSCTKVQKTLAAIPRPKVSARTKAARARDATRYAIAIDKALIRGVRLLRAVTPPPKLQTKQREWLAAVRVALRARLRLDTAPAAEILAASRAEVRARRKANRLAGDLAIASGCTLVP